MHKRFYQFNGALCISVNGRTHKHCGKCGVRLRCDHDLLTKHCDRFHMGEKVPYLSFDGQPSCGLYTNFEAYLADPDVELEQKEN